MEGCPSQICPNLDLLHPSLVLPAPRTPQFLVTQLKIAFSPSFLYFFPLFFLFSLHHPRGSHPFPPDSFCDHESLFKHIWGWREGEGVMALTSGRIILVLSLQLPSASPASLLALGMTGKCFLPALCWGFKKRLFWAKRRGRGWGRLWKRSKYQKILKKTKKKI